MNQTLNCYTQEIAEQINNNELFFFNKNDRYNETLQDWNDPEVLEIPHWLNGIIISALAMSIICNICVLFRFLEQHVYHSVILSLITATIQGTIISCV